MNTILKELKIARQEKGLNQSEFGNKLGLPQSHISKIEREETNPRLSTVIDMARIVDRELMLVPRRLAPVIRTMIDGGHEQDPMWKPDEG
ncbi:MAG: helix-turn-helix transcriptional regulator [Deltaproteobacteria bacterium]|nr:helix-turn-helix transcriptional regulator [Deltaproteobacteria bacterium]MBW2632793.1 helix-turn-helix transcriptional regulator [Deltaproteobacteria bacterium]MBW2676932.1 helix-turn-helix transcriptional regulator [Deltaproteobacteria bacterium]